MGLAQDHVVNLITKGQHFEALALLREAMDGGAREGWMHFSQAFCLYVTGDDVQQALSHYNAAEAAGFDPFRVLLNRGILFAEAGDFGSARHDFRRAAALEATPAIAAEFLVQTERNLRGINSAADRYYRPPHIPHLDANWLETCSIPQSTQFMIDCLPLLRRLLAQASPGETLEVLDVGTASAGGPGLLSNLHSGHFFGPRLQVDAMDVVRRYRGYAQMAFPNVNYLCANLFQYDPQRRWDLVMCSHTIEHIVDPLPLIRECQRRARRWALFYAPFEEQNLITG
ncbi:MAG: class I SAM-dependent methyltransferase, partial [Bryobacterales bacterium]|nr:class I SAM-dependent methyltransferase [Bryobacterales bacterium]